MVWFRRIEWSRWLFLFSCLMLVFCLGLASAHFRVFPYPELRKAVQTIKHDGSGLDWWQYRAAPAAEIVLHDVSRMMPGLTLISRNPGPSAEQHRVEIVTPEGQVLHQWDFDWDQLWAGDTSGYDYENADVEHVHGIKMLANGDLVFNYTEATLFRISPCGDVIWRLAELAHHSIHIDETGAIWAPNQVRHQTPVDRLPNHKPPFFEFLLMKVSPEGEILREISVQELLMQNGLLGLLYLATLQNEDTLVTGDTLHLNDIEVFPSSMEEGVFKHGDVMISLRNINTVLVFDPETLKMRHIMTGTFLRQHDPDFVDGNTISLYDNNNLLPAPFDNSSDSSALDQSSRILQISADDGDVSVLYQGTSAQPFFSNIMGNHQILQNGNILIAEARTGRAFEVTSDGSLLWEYFNIIEPGYLGLMEDAQRLPPEFNEAFFAKIGADCAAATN